MICKEVAYDLAMNEWKALLDSGTLSAEQTKTARIRRAGLKAEKNMAYYLNAELGGKAELLVFNNLKFTHRDLTAQIDHLVLSRWSAYFIETKSVSGKINISADGQWARSYGKGRYDNFESPLAQNRRHQILLFEMLESRVPEFMGKILGMQKYFGRVIDIRHYVAISVEATIQGKGKKAVAEYLRRLDEIPKEIHDHHQAVRSSTLGSLLAEVGNPKTKKRDPAFTKQELDACRQLLLDVDISQTPLALVHEFIESLPEQTTPRCPKCDSDMILRTAKRGQRKGNKFYGCTRYPKCKETIDVD
ncbi:MAG: NERD domain-containing protein [Phycisphaerae bacterium]|jgi:hypothetical protein|nr:NERD domain-containing protein [Phycisphaerae bacterium]